MLLAGRGKPESFRLALGQSASGVQIDHAVLGDGPSGAGLLQPNRSTVRLLWNIERSVSGRAESQCTFSGPCLVYRLQPEQPQEHLPESLRLVSVQLESPWRWLLNSGAGP